MVFVAIVLAALIGVAGVVGAVRVRNPTDRVLSLIMGIVWLAFAAALSLFVWG